MVLRRLSWVLTVLIVLLLVAGGAVSSLALFAPFHPGDALFSLQYSVEQARLFLISDQTELAERFLDLVERRLGDLEARIGTEHELVALDYLDQAVNQAVLAIDAAPPENRGPLLTRLATLALRLENILQRLTVIPTTNPDVYANALAKAEALLNSINTAHARPDDSGVSSVVNLSLGLPSDVGVNPAAAAAPTPVLIAPHPIPFPPNATPGPHDFFPLTGRHATLACADCHANGRYRGTARQCIECHAAAAPVNHFPGSCDTCHSTAAWKPATFNHTGFTDCVGCHLQNKPANHWEGQCSTCHSTSAWKPATFNHAGFTDCVSCHTKDKPANHYEGASCHTSGNYSSWTCATCHDQGKMDEKHKEVPGYTSNCIACHANGRKP